MAFSVTYNDVTIVRIAVPVEAWQRNERPPVPFSQ